MLLRSPLINLLDRNRAKNDVSISTGNGKTHSLCVTSVQDKSVHCRQVMTSSLRTHLYRIYPLHQYSIMSFLCASDSLGKDPRDDEYEISISIMLASNEAYSYDDESGDDDNYFVDSNIFYEFNVGFPFEDNEVDIVFKDSNEVSFKY